MHQALYRKWRPKTFSEVCGQEHITSILQYEVRNGKTTHAYLFSGSRGTGKTSCAKILAKALNCQHPTEQGDPCCVCDACLSIDNGTATDVLEMDAASNTGVDYIRDIKEAVVYTPSALKNRVYIIDEVHMLSTSAFNALLKTLEEPPSHVVFILATTEPQKIPVTILSRCKRFEFRRIGVNVISERLMHIASCEGIDLSPDASELIAKLASGGMRDAISLLELCAGSGERITLETVYNVGGVSGRDSIIRMIDAVETCDYETIFKEIGEKYNSAKDLSVFFSDMLSFYRDMLVVKRTKSPMDYLEISKAEFEQLKAVADKYPIEKLSYHSKLLEEAYITMQKGTSSKRLAAEFSLVRMCDPRLDTSPEALALRISALEDGVQSIPKAKSETEKAVNTEIALPKEEDRGSAEKVQSVDKVFSEIDYWAEVVAKIQNHDKPAATFLEMAKTMKDERNGNLIIYLQNLFALNMVNKNTLKTLLLNIAAQYDKDIKGISFELEESKQEHEPIDELFN